MKQLMTTLALATLALSANARSFSTAKHIAIRNTHNNCAAAKMDMQGSELVFGGLSRGKTDMYVMDAKGNLERSCKVSRQNNTVNVSKLSQGNHIIVLKQGAGVKMFEYSADVVIKAAKYKAI